MVGDCERKGEWGDSLNTEKLPGNREEKKQDTAEVGPPLIPVEMYNHVCFHP